MKKGTLAFLNSKQLHDADAKHGKCARASHDWFLVILLIGRESGARFLNQSLHRYVNQSKREFLSTLLK